MPGPSAQRGVLHLYPAGGPKVKVSKHLEVQILVGSSGSWIFITIVLWRVPNQNITLFASALWP